MGYHISNEGMRSELEKLLDADPFVPFEIRIAGSWTARVDALGGAWLRGDILVMDDPRGYSLIDLRHIAFIYVEGAHPRPPESRPGPSD